MEQKHKSIPESNKNRGSKNNGLEQIKNPLSRNLGYDNTVYPFPVKNEIIKCPFCGHVQYAQTKRVESNRIVNAEISYDCTHVVITYIESIDALFKNEHRAEYSHWDSCKVQLATAIENRYKTVKKESEGKARFKDLPRYSRAIDKSPAIRFRSMEENDGHFITFVFTRMDEIRSTTKSQEEAIAKLNDENDNEIILWDVEKELKIERELTESIFAELNFLKSGEFDGFYGYFQSLRELVGFDACLLRIDAEPKLRAQRLFLTEIRNSLYDFVEELTEKQSENEIFCDIFTLAVEKLKKNEYTVPRGLINIVLGKSD